MLKKTIIGFMLALFAGPLSAHAEMPGQPCTAAQIGTTKMADDKQNIIACLVTGNVAPENVQEWKSMTSSGGGVTGGCFISTLGSVSDRWGQGCNSTASGSGTSICKRVAASGYSCGIIFADESSSASCGCVKK